MSVSASLKVGQVTLKLVGQQSFVQLSNPPPLQVLRPDVHKIFI